MSYRDILAAQLRIDEGVRSKPYKDSVGKLTIGVGRNLDDVGLSPQEINLLLQNDIIRADADARTLISNFDSLSEQRQAALVNMVFNMGRGRVAQFQKMLAAIEAGDFDEAANQMLNSLWARQVGIRAVRLAERMRVG